MHCASRPTAPGRGFTLVELLVVFAVIALLAALLLPALAAAKASAKSAACKSNLRQLGVALQLYVTDYEKYPGNGASYYSGAFGGIGGTGMNWLNPYVGVQRGDPNSRLYLSTRSRTVFNCPAVPPELTRGLFGTPWASSYGLGYGYNELGTGWRDEKFKLGLGFTVSTRSFDNFIFDPPHYVTPEDIRNPGDMIAIGDSGAVGWLVPNHPASGESTLDGQHLGHRANVVFCDGHIENNKAERWNAATDEARKRWNNDNLPHPETWR